MGWSCGVRAGWVADAWTDACVVNSGSQNVFDVGGHRYFWEMSRKEHSDGAITGTVWKYVDDTHVRKAGSFRISGAGVVERAPRFLKAVSPSVDVLADRYAESFDRPTPERRVSQNRAAFARDIANR